MHEHERDPSSSGAFGTVGWLFADLMVALVMLFLVASSVGRYIPPTQVNPTVTPVPTATVLPVLALQPITITLTIDYHGLLANDPVAVSQAQQQIRGTKAISGKRAGLVLTYEGAANNQQELAYQIAGAFDTGVLSGLGKQGFVFTGTVYRAFLNLNNPPGVIQIDVYVFK